MKTDKGCPRHTARPPEYLEEESKSNAEPQPRRPRKKTNAADTPATVEYTNGGVWTPDMCREQGMSKVKAKSFEKAKKKYYVNNPVEAKAQKLKNLKLHVEMLEGK